MSESVLQLNDVSKNFDGLLAVDRLNLEIRGGEICGLIGPNGAGKSTVFNIICGQFAPSSGSIHLEGRDVTGLKSHEIARLGIARSFQLVHLLESMTVEENVLVATEDHEHWRFWSAATHLGAFGERDKAARARAREAIALVGIPQLAARQIESLSFGQQRLVGAARALASRPRLVLLDEPAAGLSEEELVLLRDAIDGFRASGAAVLLVEHNVEFVLGLCEHVVVLNFGQKIADGSSQEIRQSPAVIEAYLGAP